MKNKNHRLWRGQYGQTLVEVLIALGAATLIVSAIVVVVLSSLGNAQFTKNQNLATQFAQEGMEIVKKSAQSDWSSFSSRDSKYCQNSDFSLTSVPAAGCGQNVGSPIPTFVREVDIFNAVDPQSSNCNPPTPTPPGTGARVQASMVTVIVSWSDSKCTGVGPDQYCHQVKLTSCISNNSGAGAP